MNIMYRTNISAHISTLKNPLAHINLYWHNVYKLNHPGKNSHDKLKVTCQIKCPSSFALKQYQLIYYVALYLHTH